MNINGSTRHLRKNRRELQNTPKVFFISSNAFGQPPKEREKGRIEHIIAQIAI